MTRSDAAIARRAAKRARSEDEQRIKDGITAFGPCYKKPNSLLKSAINITTEGGTSTIKEKGEGSDALFVGCRVNLTWVDTEISVEGTISAIKDKVSSKRKLDEHSNQNRNKKYTIQLDEKLMYEDGTSASEITTRFTDVRYTILSQKSSISAASIVTVGSGTTVSPAIVDQATRNWLCPKCNNSNFSSRIVCNRCDHYNSDSHVHNQSSEPEKPKISSWKHQHNPETVLRNEYLREVYVTNKESLNSDDLKRAEILVARSERKKLQNKKNKKDQKPRHEEKLKSSNNEIEKRIHKKSK